MPATKLIYGVGRVPKASEFALGEIIVNVDDSKVYSKNKSNIVFEIGGGSTTIVEGDTITSTAGFTTASISASGFFTTVDTSNLIISGGTGVSVTTGSNNQIIITATGDSEVTNAINADTASYVEIAQTASYVNTSDLDGTLFQLSNDGDQGGIIFSENNIDIFSNVGAYAAGLNETSNVTFAQVSSSGLLFASASEETTGGDNIRAVVYDTASGQFYFTGSYGSGGGGGDDGDWFIDTVNSKLTASLDLLLTSSNQNQYIYFNSGNINDVSNLKNAYISNTISDTTYGQEIKLENYYNEGVIELEIGADPYITAKKSGVTDPAVIVNDDAKDIDFNVKGDTDTDLIYANAGTDKVGIGYNNPSEKLSVDGNIYANNILYLGSAAGSPKIQFNKSVNAASATTAEVSILADNSSYKQSLNFFNVVGSGRYSSLTIGSNEYFKANFNNGARADKYFIINGDDTGVDFIVSGSNFPDLLVAAVDSDNVGVGFGSSSLSATYSDYKLAVSGNLYTDGYLTLASKDNTTGVAGALLYSSSNEFYLGFS